MNKKKSKKVIVTGGAGFIGGHLVDTLVEHDYKVGVIDDLSGGKKSRVNKKAKLHVLDIVDLKAIQPIFKGAEYVFHLAALPRVQISIEKPIETNRINVIGTLNVLKAAHEAGVKKVVYAASSSAYGDQTKMPLVETMPANPKSPYGLQKYIGELYCRLYSEIYNLPTVCLRFFNVYGPGSDPNGAYALVIAKFLKQRSEGKELTITGDGKQTRDFTHVRDVVRANLLAAKSGKVGHGEVINIGAGRAQSVKRIAELIGGKVKHLPARLEPKHTLADNRLAKRLLSWTPKVKIEEGVSELKKLAGLD